MSKKKEKEKEKLGTITSLEHIKKEMIHKDYDLLDRELTMELKKVQLSEKRLALQEKQQEVEQMENRRLQNDERKTTIEMIEVITDAMLGHVIDSERSILGSEPHYIPVFDEIERGLLKKKVFDLLKQF